uniref:Uncharacterized protein n=1 Tax=Arundo donax TaxID=35708 RepID=A0A0A9A3H6_ARUDO
MEPVDSQPTKARILRAGHSGGSTQSKHCKGCSTVVAPRK